jgi:hypothetical protein
MYNNKTEEGADGSDGFKRLESYTFRESVGL